MALCRSSGFSKIAKCFSTYASSRAPVEVMISQSTNFMANTALEEWVKRNATFKRKNLLLLSSSCVNSGRNIKAFFLTEEGSAQTAVQVKHEHDQQAELVFGSLPKDAVMRQLPVVTVSEEDRSVLISVPLENPSEGDVVLTLQTIADSMVNTAPDTSTTRISLVRPDGGWFPGIQQIREDMEASLKEIAAIQKDKRREQAHIDLTPRHNSYGSYF